MSVRNNPAKPGKKPAPKPTGGRKADEVRLREQWDDAWEDYVNWRARVKRRGKTTENRFGERVRTPEYGGLESSRKHLLAVSRALADVLGLSSEDEERRSKIAMITAKRAERAGGGG